MTLRRTIAAVFLFAAPLAALVVSQADWLYNVPAITVEDRPAINFLYVPHTGYYEHYHTWLVPFLATYKENNIRCTTMAAQFLDEPRLLNTSALRSRIGCHIQNFPEALPATFEKIVIPAQRYIVLHRKNSGAPRQWLYWQMMKRYAAEHKLNPHGDVMEVYDLDMKNRGAATMLMSVDD